MRKLDLAPLCSTVGCGSSSPGPTPPASSVISYPATVDPASPRADGDLARLAAGNDAFAGRLCARLARANGSFAYSPFSTGSLLVVARALDPTQT